MSSPSLSREVSQSEVLDLTRSSIPPEELLLTSDDEDLNTAQQGAKSSRRELENVSSPIKPRSTFSHSLPDDMRRPDLSRLHPTSSSSSRQAQQNEESCGIASIAFGVFSDANSFSAEWERGARGTDVVLFQEEKKRGGKQCLIVRMWEAGPVFGSEPSQLSSVGITIEVSTVTRVQQSAGGKSIYLHLHRPPLLETLARRDGYSSHTPPPRQVAGFDDQHVLVAPFCSKTLRLHLRTRQDVKSFARQAEKYGLPRIVSTKIGIEANSRFGMATLARINRWTGEMDFRFAFQVEKLLRNGLVDAAKLVGLEKKIRDIVRVQGIQRAERILILFADSLSRLEDLGEERPTEVVVVDGNESLGIDRKRRRDDSPVIVSESDNSSDIEDDDEVILPPSLIPSTRSNTARHPFELSLDQLLMLLDRAVTRSISFAQLYSSADPTMLARQVTITPTSYQMSGPNLEDSNSIIRKYGRPEMFLRVTVRSEDGSLIRNDSRAIVETRFKKLFRNGFDLGGRRWEFLAFASSALKSSTCFFVSPFSHRGIQVTPTTIHRSIGEFAGTETAKITAKYMARIAQAFSGSRPSIELASRQIIEIPELVSSTGSMYSDGVGLISPSLAADVVAALDIKLGKGRRPPTCFQVRIGGAKGMLQVDPTLAGKMIALRPSQIKFKSTSTSLEIAGTFEAAPGYLNRPLVKLLEDLGVPSDAFLRHQATATKSIRKSRSALRSAIRLLDDWNLSTSSHLSSTLSFLSRNSRTSAAAFRNPFVAQLLDSAVIHTLREIKYKARIPLAGCYNLVGVVDVEGILEEDEIYARIQTREGKSHYISGTVAISRSPTNHPGDCRLVKAVGKFPPGKGERIRNLINCVVFPAKGARSLPSMLAGGDLDGDVYLLLPQSSGLAPRADRISPPADYSPALVTKLVDREATVADGSDFFFDFIAQDRTALIATRQLLLADFRPAGLFDPDCLKLAQLHSESVDFVKSGTPVFDDVIPRVPAALKERGYPDFLSGDDPNSYRSPRILGQLFRAISFDTVKSPNLDPTAVDSLRSLTTALLSLEVLGLDDFKLATSPCRPLVIHFEAYLEPFASELAKIADLSSPPAREEELFLNVIVGTNKLDRSDKQVFSRRRERCAELFGLVRKEIGGREQDPTKLRVETAWAAWNAVVEADEEHGKREKESGRTGADRRGKFGYRSWGFVALGVLGDLLAKLEREQIEEIVID